MNLLNMSFTKLDFLHRQLQPSLLSPFLLNFVQVTPYFSIIFHT